MLKALVKRGLLPAAVYFAAFVILTYPLILSFSTDIFSDNPDALQNIWNFWWFKQAATHQVPDLWHTTALFAPFGSSLYTHALTPLNGFFALMISQWLSLTETYNTLVILSFVLSGLFMFWLADYLLRAYIPSLLVGFWFSFNIYHFTHASSHIEMASMQWLILFIWVFLKLMQQPTTSLAVIAAMCLRLVLWNTPYHFFYAVMVILITLAYKRRYSASLAVFLGLTVLLTFSQNSA